MGINLNAGFSRIIKGRRSYKEFAGKRMLMLGKQEVNFCRGRLKEVLNRIDFRYRTDIVDIDDYDERNEKIDSCDLFRLLGFTDVHALDISDYEGADIIYDLSDTELPQELRGKFDCIFDGGVLEHVFDFPRALTNVSKMLKVGGKVIHDMPCGNWIDHGFYSFSPTCLIDYYSNHQFYINDIYLMAYHYPDSGAPITISPDCRYNDSNAWSNSFANGHYILLICEATKEGEAEYDLSFPQYSYKMLGQSLEKEKELYSYKDRMKRIKLLLDADPGMQIAIYGSGATAHKMICELHDYTGQIAGVYDRNIENGTSIEFKTCKKRVLNIDDIHRDKVQCIVLGSEKTDVIELLRQRMKYLKKNGVQII